jgi:uncharacterized protein (DUF4415 family)
MKGGNMKYVTSDGSILTPAETACLDAIEAKMGDSLEIPEITDEQWATAVAGKFYKARKEPISLRLDMDVLDWLRRSGPGYQTKINAILREKMLSETVPQA